MLRNLLRGGGMRYLHGEDERPPAVTPVRRLRVEPLLSFSHETGFEDVAAAAVLTEQPVVQVHALPSCLEVQRH